MSKQHAHARARQLRQNRRRLAHPLVIGGALFVIAITGLLLATLLLGQGPQTAAETNNVKGLASAPVEVEEWSDFQ